MRYVHGLQDKLPPQPIRAIQTEEVAIKELSRLYGSSNVRLAKGFTAPPS